MSVRSVKNKLSNNIPNNVLPLSKKDVEDLIRPLIKANFQADVSRVVDEFDFTSIIEASIARIIKTPDFVKKLDQEVFKNLRNLIPELTRDSDEVYEAAHAYIARNIKQALAPKKNGSK